jgi:protoporphyrinogen oxidase
MQEVCFSLLELLQKEFPDQFAIQFNSAIENMSLLPNVQKKFELNGLAFHGVLWCAPHWLERTPEFLRSKFEPVFAKAEFHHFAVVCLGMNKNFIQKHHLPHPLGFGCLSFEEVRDCLGVLYVHSIYIEHVPDSESVLYRVMLGGDKHPNILNASNIEIAKMTLQALIGMGFVSQKVSELIEQTIESRNALDTNCLKDSECVLRIFRWQNAFPLPTEHWFERDEARRNFQSEHTGFLFAGLDVQGVAVHNSVESAQQAAHSLKEILATAKIIS